MPDRPQDSTQPAAVTAAELRGQFLDTCRTYAGWWADPANTPDRTCRQRIEGFLHSVLCIIDGVTGLPAFQVLADPHPDDKQYCIENGESWIEPGTDITAGNIYLHDELYGHGAWAGQAQQHPAI